MSHRPALCCSLILLLATACSASRTIPAAAPGTAFNPAVRGATTPVIDLNARSSGPAVSADVYGASIGTWWNFRQSFVNPSLRKAAMKLVRFPGGSESDAYHWENGGSLCNGYGYITPGATFDNLMHHAARPLDLDVAITLNYGSNRACNGGGEPSEAAAWVAYAKQHSDRVPYWTVGNEVYGSWEYDLHAKPHDPATYSDAVRTGFYPAVKKANSNAKLGIVVDTPDDTAWNDAVLSKAQPFDFVELHYYPEYNVDNDQRLLGQDVDSFANDLNGLRKQMDDAGVSKNVPIYLGEFNNDAGNEGKQSVSIVNGLFLGQMLGTLEDAGVPMATWWLAYGQCDESGDYSKKLYGWQHFGTETLFSDGLPNAYEYCGDTPKIPGGTPFPTARVMTLFANKVPAGSQVRTVSLPKSLGTNIRAYGFSVSGGYALVLFNNTLEPIRVEARVSNSGKSSFTATLSVYGKAQYDKSKDDQWVAPLSKNLGKVGTTIPLALGPYSVSALTLK
ncbi:MAG TPA: hypothetical protein VGG51_02930 [Candidatus Cybelea sp.]|jgi:hypothetical protein